MKKNIFFVFVLAVLMMIGGQAFADDGEERTRFYDFENMLIDGEFRSPDLMLMEGTGHAQFDRLLNLRTSFLPKVQESSEDPALR